jgi:excisionase family DNA binding protein
MNTSTTQHPTAHDAQTARIALEKLESQDNTNLETHLDLTLPAPAVNLLRELLEAMSKGQAVAVLPLDSELGTFELADLLGTSRPHAIGLLERGLIPFRNVGAHRRVRVEDALKFKAEQRQRSLEAMAALQAENEALGLQ